MSIHKFEIDGNLITGNPSLVGKSYVLLDIGGVEWAVVEKNGPDVIASGDEMEEGKDIFGQLERTGIYTRWGENKNTYYD